MASMIYLSSLYLLGSLLSQVISAVSVVELEAYQNSSELIKMTGVISRVDARSNTTLQLTTVSNPSLDFIYCLDGTEVVSNQARKTKLIAQAGDNQTWKLILPSTPSVYTAILAGINIPCYAVNSRSENPSLFPFFLNSKEHDNVVITVADANKLLRRKIPLLDALSFLTLWLIVLVLVFILLFTFIPLCIFYTNSTRTYI